MVQQEMIIFKRAYDFSKWLLNHTGRFPKSHRFSVAVKIESAMMDFIRLITIANMRAKKLPLLKSADEELTALRILLRLSHELKFITTSSYEFAAKSMEEIGRLLGGWLNSQKE